MVAKDISSLHSKSARKLLILETLHGDTVGSVHILADSCYSSQQDALELSSRNRISMSQIF